MEDLNLTIGQKVWCIQLGECIVVEVKENGLYKYICMSIRKIERVISYTPDGKNWDSDIYPSLFLSNPFKNKEKQETIEISIPVNQIIDFLNKYKK